MAKGPIKICPFKGIRQGGPLSPYLFFICSRCLAQFVSPYCVDEDN